jgi:geranylgeranyl diphosphate synthase type II
MDNATVRRGLPTVHNKWSSNTAILSGDAMMIESYKLMAKTTTHCLSAVLEVFSNTASGVCEGQMYDMQFENRDNVTEAEYIEMIRLKTSVLLAASLKVGALVGGASEKDANLLYEVGLNIGLAFQLLDDWLDVYSNPEVFGKKTGGDIVENKKTYLLINALQKAEGETKKELLSWIEKSEFVEDEKIEAIKNIYDKLRIGELTQAKALAYSQKAYDGLAQVAVAEESKQQLVELIKYLLERDK